VAHSLAPAAAPAVAVVDAQAERAATQPAPAAAAPGEPRWAAALEALDFQQLQHLCVTLRVERTSVDAALQPGDARRALIVTDLGPRLRELGGLPLKQLRAETLAAGVGAEELMDALDEA
jgi:hypothetical protein